jgi:DNA-binding SARP family transcriptional activator/tetratricopeptide (TPR) repeat protein
VRFRILGPLWADRMEITAQRDRIVLAMLLLHANRIVAVEDLIDAVWDADPPATARGQLQTCVSRLRRLLPSGAIGTDPAGYGISVAGDDLDATVHNRLVAEARAAVEPDVARHAYRRALDLWRGSALAGLESRAVRQAAAVLDEQHAVVTEDWIDLELQGGRDRDLVAELSGLVERFPLRERLRGQLMTTLARAGRPAEALTEFRRIRATLHGELGIEPGPELQTLHRRILAGELTAPVPPIAPAPVTPVRNLPRAVGDFTGRDDLLGALRDQIDTAPAGPIVHVVDGMAGIGKTTFAVRLANLVGERFPDAHLFLDLQTVAPAAALVTLLRQLGVEPARIPADSDERVAMWRDELARRRALVVLDNAASSAQVVPLLPGSGDNLVLVTSRRRLIGLDGVQPHPLPVLAEAEAVELFGRIVGERASAEPEQVREVIQRCGRLPLAIRLAGSRLAHRPRWRVADLLRRLGSAALPELSAEDRTVTAAFALSYGHLPEPERRMFRLLGLHPGVRFGATAAAALADLPLDEAEDLLDALVDVHLVDEPEPGRYRLHDLIREYAATLAAGEPPGDRRDAVHRLLDFHLHAIAVTGMGAQRQNLVRDLRLGEPLRKDLADAVTDHVGHLERERPHLAGYGEAGVAAGLPQYAWLLPRAAWRHLFTRGYLADIATLHERAMTVAEEHGDRSAIAMSANSLASAYSRLGRHDDARRTLELCVRLRRELGDQAGMAKAIGNLAVVYVDMGRYADGIAVCRESMRICRRLGDDSGIALRHDLLGNAYTDLGRFDAALRHHRLQLLQVIETGETISVATCLRHIGMIKRRAGLAPVGALRRLQRTALRLHQTVGYAIGQAEAYTELAVLCRAEGRFAEAIDRHRRAVELAEPHGHRRFVATCLNDWADTMIAAGDRPAARELYGRVVAIGAAAHPYELARAYHGLAAADPADADRHRTRARDLFHRLGVPDLLRSPPAGGRMKG